MNIKAFVSPIALATALALTGGAAFAQDAAMEAEGSTMMIGEQTVSADDMATVQNFCLDLINNDEQESTSMDSGVSTDDTEDDNESLSEQTSVIDFSTITVTQCEEFAAAAEMEMEVEMEAAPQG